MAIELKTKYTVTHSNGTNSLSKLNGRSALSPDEQYLAVTSTVGDICLTIYKIDREQKTVTIVENISNTTLPGLNLQSIQGIKYSPDNKWLLVWTPTDIQGTGCYIYPVNGDGTLGTRQQIQGMTPLNAYAGFRVMCDAQWSSDGKYIMLGLQSGNTDKQTIKILSFDDKTGIATEIHNDVSHGVNTTGGFLYSIWTPKGDKCCAFYDAGRKYFQVDKTTNTVKTITWSDMFDIEPAFLGDITQTWVSVGFKHIQYANTARTNIINYAYDEGQDKFVKTPELHTDIKQLIAGAFVGIDNSEQNMLLHKPAVQGHCSVCKFKEDTKEWVLDTSQNIVMPNYEKYALGYYGLHSDLYCRGNILALFHSTTQGTIAHNAALQVWDMTGLAPQIMQITGEDSKVYHPETNSDIVLVGSKSLTSVINDIQNDIQSVEAEVTTLESKLQGDEYGIIHKTKPTTLRNGDFYIG